MSIRILAALVAVFFLVPDGLAQSRADGQADSVTSIDGDGDGTFTGSYTHVSGTAAPHPWFRFSAAAGQVVTIDVQTPGWTSLVWIYDVFDDDAQIGDQRTIDYSNAIDQGGVANTYTVSFIPPSDGQYIVQLDSWVGGSGAYTVTVSGAVMGFVDLSISKTAPATAVAGTQITYSLDVAAAGGAAGTFAPVPANFTDISATGTPVSLSDDAVSGDIPLPFSFDFQGQAKNDIRISSNGFLTFSPQTNNGCCSGQAIPNPAPPNDVIAFFWVDLNPAAGGQIDYQTLGTAPNRRFIVQFTGVPHFGGGGGPVTAQAILYEGSNDIEFQYVSAPPDGSPTTVGIENADGTIALQIANAAVSYSNEGFLIQQQSTPTATGVSVSDPLPAGTTFVSATGCTNTPSGPVVSCDLADIPPGGSASASITVAIDPSFTGTLDNTATVAADQADSDSSNDSSTASTVVGAEADLAVTKTGPASAIAGSSVTYTVTVTNNGPSTASSVSVDDPTPAGYTFVSATAPCAGGFPCPLGDMMPGSAVAFDVTYATSPSAGGSVVTNTATASSPTFDPNGGNDSGSATTTLGAEADLAITKSGPATAIAGTQVTYDITVTNNGPSDATSVSVADPTPAGYTFASATAPCAGGFPCALGTVAAGANVAFQVTYDIDPATTGGVTNTATVSSATTDPNGANDSASATTTVSGEADLGVIKTGPASAVAGGQVTYTITVDNAGPSQGASVSLADPTPAGYTFASATAPCAGGFPCALGDMAPGATVAVDVTFDVDPSTTGDVTNTATVSSPTTDPNATNDSSSATTTIGADADLSIVKTVDNNAVQQGETVTYTLAVSNAGPSDATNVVITDNLPQGQVLVSTSGCFEDPSGAPTCSIGTVAAGSTVAVTLTAQVQRATGLQTNTASVDSDTTDPVSANNTGSVGVVASFSIPTLGSWGLIALMLTLMVAGGLQVRRMT